MRLGVRIGTCAFAAGVAALSWVQSGIVAGAPPLKDITLTPLGVHRTGWFDRGGSEIVAYDPATRRAYSVNLQESQVDVIDISNPASPVELAPIDVSSWGTQANSVDVHGGVVAIAIEANPKTSPGSVLFTTASGDFLSRVQVGALPDMLTFTPDGRYVLVANEGEPNSYNQGASSIDPEGSVSIIDMRNGAAHVTQADVAAAGFSQFPRASLDESIRIFGPNASVAQDLEPEYIAVSHDSKTAWVTLQENNAIGILDIHQKTFTTLVGLGFKDHSQAGQGFDSSDRDAHANSIVPRPVWGMYQPDGIAAFEHQGKTYLITANEGDVREWTGIGLGLGLSGNNNEAIRVGSLTLDADTFEEDPDTLKATDNLGRLNVTKFNGNTSPGAGPDFEALFAFGTRSFSIWTAGVSQIFDSGDALEQLIANTYPPTGGGPGFFNATSTNGTNDQADGTQWTHDNRSDDKGPEPENVIVARLFGRQFAFIALERIGGVVVRSVLRFLLLASTPGVHMMDLSDPRSRATAQGESA